MRCRDCRYIEPFTSPEGAIKKGRCIFKEPSATKNPKDICLSVNISEERWCPVFRSKPKPMPSAVYLRELGKKRESQEKWKKVLGTVSRALDQRVAPCGHCE